jgi:hypothetical protein
MVVIQLFYLAGIHNIKPLHMMGFSIPKYVLELLRKFSLQIGILEAYGKRDITITTLTTG